MIPSRVMKRVLITGFLTALIGGVVFLLVKSSDPPPAQQPHSSNDTSANTLLPNKTSGQTSTTVNVAQSSKTLIANANFLDTSIPSGTSTSRPAPLTLISRPPDFTNLPPETVLENMRAVFRSYHSMFRENPIGTNPEITRALNGENPKQTRFLNEEDGLRVSGSGELVDSWGTAFFFHQLSGAEMEIRSAGPDRLMWTSDDLLIK
jgi:hypothetical protein